MHWEKASEGRLYLPDDFKSESLTGIAYPVIDSENFTINFDARSSQRIGRNQAHVRLLGVVSIGDGSPRDLSSYQFQALDLLKTLIENKKVELIFDSEVWDSDSNLLACVVLDDGRILQNELLISGLAIADVTVPYARRQSFIDTQKKAIASKSGVWSVLSAPPVSEASTVISQKVALASGLPSLTPIDSSPKILITEVFPLPSSTQESSSLLSQEWIELLNTGSGVLSLQGWTIAIGKKVITFGPSSILEPGKHIVFFVHQVGLKLKNDGDTMTLASPDGSSIAKLTYPKLKVGESYVFDEQTAVYCKTGTATPGQQGHCASSTVASVSKTKKSLVAAKAKLSKPRKSAYDSYAKSYEQEIRETNSGNQIVLSSDESQSISLTLSIIFGILLGALASVLALKIPAVRVLIG